MKNWIKILIGVLILACLVGSVSLTIWVWETFPKWLILGSYCLEILIAIWLIRRWR